MSLPAAPPSPQKYIGALPVIDASKFGDVCQHVGDKVELVGQIFEVKAGSTRKGTPYVFINFGHWRDDCVRVTLWSEGLKALGVTPDYSWHGQWIVVNGLIDPVYHGKNRYKTIEYRSVGITLSDRSQLHKITQDEALWRLGRGVRPGSPVPHSTAPAPSQNEDILRHIQGKPVPSGAASRPTTSQPQATPSGSKPQQATPQPSTVKSRNEAILKGLTPSGSSHPSGVSRPKGSGQPAKTPTNDNSGCLIAIAIIVGLIILMEIFGR